MQNYYTIGVAHEDYTDGTKKTAGFNGFAPDYDEQAEDSYRRLIESEDIPSSVNLNYLLVDDKDELTDIINPLNGNYFLLSPKFKSILEDCNIVSHRFYPAKILHKGEFKDYFLIFMLFDYIDYIDFQKSKFGLYSKKENFIKPKRIKDIKFEQRKDFDNTWTELRKEKPLPMTVIKKERLVFSKDFNFDLFYVFTTIFISHRLYTRLMDEGIKGINYKPSDLIQDKDLIT